MTAVAAESSARSPGARLAGALPLGRSVLVNILGPALAYRALEPAFPSPSVVPLLAAAAIPAAGLLVVFARRRTVDAVAVISLVQQALVLAIAVLSRSPRAAMTGHALQAGALGLVFAASVLAGRNLIVPLARQTMAGDDLGRQVRFDAIAREPGPRRSFTLIAWAWTVALCAQSALQLVLLRALPARDYLLTANALGYGVTALLIWASIRYGRRAAQAYRQPAA